MPYPSRCLIPSVLFMQEGECDSAISSSSHRSFSSLERIRHSGKCAELMRYFSPAKGSLRKLDGKFAIALHGHLAIVPRRARISLRNSETSRIIRRLTEYPVFSPPLLFYSKKLNYPRTLEAYSSRCRGSRSVRTNRKVETRMDFSRPAAL